MAPDAWDARESSWLLAGILWIIDRLRPFYAAFGVEHVHLRELLRARLLLGLRTKATRWSAWDIAGVVLAILLTWLLGLAMGIFLLVSRDVRTWIVVSQSLLVLLVTMLLFQHLANVLVDPADIAVVAPHPVRGRTLLAVRLTEVFAYVLIAVLGFAAGNVMLAVFAAPPLAVLLLFPLLSLLSGVTTLGVVTLLFALCLRIAGPARFQRVTLWVQVVVGGVLFGGLQLVNVTHDTHWAHLLAPVARLRWLWPPFQYAEIFALACGSENRAGPLLFAAAVLVPLAALAATFWLVSRTFAAGLQGSLGESSGRSGWKRGLLARAGARITRGEERAGFDFALALSRREPHFLRGVLPQLVMYQCMSLGMGLRTGRDLDLFLPFSAGLLFLNLPMVLTLSQSTAIPEAKGLLTGAPLESEAAFLRGGLKALLLQWIGVPALFLFCVQIAIAGGDIWPRSLLVLLSSGVLATFFASRFRLAIPFTQPIRAGVRGAANFGMMLLSGLALVLLTGVYSLFSLHPLALAGGILLMAALLALVWRGLRRVRVAPAFELAKEK